tara:strand:+ start:2669 stop:3193 length:525 start_codon:yes stop_codon:yes gene_type:complete
LDKKILKDSMGRLRTTSLFVEFKHPQMKPLYSLKEYDIETPEGVYPSLKKMYMSYDHVPGFEYDFAMDIFGSWEQWTKLCNISQLRGEMQQWRDELDIRIKASALKQMMLASKDNDAKGINAAKYLADKGYTKKAGRPSKEEIIRQTKIEAGANQELADDMNRIGLSVVNGSKH